METQGDQAFLTGVARGFGGAILFALPMLMTMEMWHLGLYIEPFRLLLLTLAGVPFLIALSHYSGFEETAYWKDDVRDGIVAYGIGAVASLGVLLMLGIITNESSLGEVVMMTAVQAVPAGFGAILANSQLRGGGDDVDRDKAEENRQERASYGGEILFMVTGALFLAANLAPTEEMVLISYRLTAVTGIALLLTSLVITHLFVYALDFRGQHPVPEGTPWWSIFVRFSMVGYAVSLLVSAYMLWTFGRFDGVAFDTAVRGSLVLAFPASLGAAAARLIL